MRPPRLTKQQKAELFQEWYGPGGKIEDAYPEDIERFHDNGDVDDARFGRGPRHVSMENLLASDDGAIDQDHELFGYQDTLRAQLYRDAERDARRAILKGAAWQVAASLALFADGVPERRIARLLERSRSTIRRWLESLKKPYEGKNI